MVMRTSQRGGLNSTYNGDFYFRSKYFFIVFIEIKFDVIYMYVRSSLIKVINAKTENRVIYICT